MVEIPDELFYGIAGIGSGMTIYFTLPTKFIVLVGFGLLLLGQVFAQRDRKDLAEKLDALEEAQGDA